MRMKNGREKGLKLVNNLQLITASAVVVQLYIQLKSSCLYSKKKGTAVFYVAVVAIVRRRRRR